jgi:hypothetical protein
MCNREGERPRVTSLEYMETQLLRKRWNILNYKRNMLGDHCLIELPDAEFTMREISDIDSVIDTLQDIKKIYEDR